MKVLYSPSFREAGHCAAAADRRKVPYIKYVGNPMGKRGERGWGWPKNGLKSQFKKVEIRKKLCQIDLHLLKDNNGVPKTKVYSFVQTIIMLCCLLLPPLPPTAPLATVVKGTFMKVVVSFFPNFDTPLPTVALLGVVAVIVSSKAL